MQTFTKIQILALATGLGCAAEAATTEPLPIGGRPVPEFAGVDTLIRNFIQDDSRNIEAGVVGISRGGRVIYLRSFGWLKTPTSPADNGTPLPETALMRVASLSKLITAAAIHELDTDGAFGAQGLGRKAFNLAGNSGVLNVEPFGGSPDLRASFITVSHLLGHAGGFLQEADPFHRLQEVANTLGVAAPPSHADLIRWRLGLPLDYFPGAYSTIQRAMFWSWRKFCPRLCVGLAPSSASVDAMVESFTLRQELYGRTWHEREA